MDVLRSEFANNCFVCNEILGSMKTELSSVTTYSEKFIYQIIEAFTDTQLDEDVINETGVCESCLFKFNEYDELITRAEVIQLDLTNLLTEPKYPDEMFMIEEENIETVEELEEVEQSVGVKDEGETEDGISYEPVFFDEIQEEETSQDTDEINPSIIQGDYLMEVVVDNTKENQTLEGGSSSSHFKPRQNLKAALSSTKNSSKRIVNVKQEGEEFIVIELDNKQRAFQCDVCCKIFKDRSKLKVHREIHTTERNVICNECGKSFKTMNCLRNHKRMHLPERIYYGCDQCDKKYTQKIQLKKHIEIVHMNRRDFICPTCGSSFGTKSVLKMHMLSHSTFRSEECSICGFKVHTKAKLRRHMKSHTGERDYQCGICNKKFLYSYNVIAHVRNVHEKSKTRSRQLTDGSNVIESIEEIEYTYEEIEEC